MRKTLSTAGQGRAALATTLAYPCLVLALSGVPVLMPGMLSDYALEVGYRTMLLLSLAEAWNLMAGYGGMVSLGTAAFFGAGGYVLTGLMNFAGLTALPALAISALAGALIAVIVSKAVFRLRGLYFTVGTLALAEALRQFMVNSSWFGGASGWFAAVDSPDARTMYIWCWGLLAVTTLLVTLYVSSRFCLALQAQRDDEDAARQLGVKTYRVKLGALALSGALTAVAGALQSIKLGAIEPYGMFGAWWSISVLTTVIIGGIGSRAGPGVGVLFVVALGEWLADLPSANVAITGLVLVIAVRYAPRGIAGLALDWIGHLHGKRQSRKTRTMAPQAGKVV